jgi:hypothetical protein
MAIKYNNIYESWGAAVAQQLSGENEKKMISRGPGFAPHPGQPLFFLKKKTSSIAIPSKNLHKLGFLVRKYAIWQPW